MCKHNHRERWTTGFYCNDCSTFFDKDSPTYRQDEHMSTLWMVLNNIGRREKGISKMMDEIGIGKLHDNFEDIISRAEALIKKHGSTPDSANITLK